MMAIAIIFVTILDITTLLTLVVSCRTKSLAKVFLIAVIATLAAELINVLVRPTYEPSSIIFLRLTGQLIVGLAAYGITKTLRGRNTESATSGGVSFIDVNSTDETAAEKEKLAPETRPLYARIKAYLRRIAVAFTLDVYAVFALFVAITLFPIVRFIAGLVTASIKGVVSFGQNVMASGLSSAVQVGGDQPNVVAAGARGMDDKHETVFDQSGNVSQEAIGSAHIGFFGDMKRLLSFDLAWSERTVLEKAYTGLFVLIVIALFPMPYGFYSSLRVMVCIGLYFYFQAILPERANRPVWFWVIVVLFVIYNPVIPVRIEEKVAWFLINFGTIYALYRARLVFDR